MDAETALIAVLTERQVNLPATDAAFAARLGMSRQMWRFLRAGDYRLSLPLLQGILRAYPDLTPMATALLFLPVDAKKSSQNDEQPACEATA